MKKKSKAEKAVKALKLLFVGQLITAFGLLGELGVINQSLYLISLISIVGIIITFVGILKLARVNIFFLISSLCVGFTLLLGIVSGVLIGVNVPQATVESFNFICNILTKLVSMLFVFGIIRGCAKAATGSASSRFAKTMTYVNFTGKVAAIAFTILHGIYSDIDPVLSETFAIISMSLSIFVELFFVCYTFRAYKKAKAFLIK